jgi:hypothetical protein
MKTNKEKKFEKVIEWQKEPLYDIMISSSLLFLVTIFSEGFVWLDLDVPSAIFLTLVECAFIAIFFNSFGHKAKVYWREIK